MWIQNMKVTWKDDFGNEYMYNLLEVYVFLFMYVIYPSSISVLSEGKMLTVPSFVM